MLREAVQSILGQSLEDLELFVSDNASTDDTAAVVASFDDPRVRYLRNETNLGPLPNMSRGFRLGTAPFLTILPDDDVMLPESLERRVRLLEDDPHVGLVHSAHALDHLGPDNEVLRTDVIHAGGRADAIEPASVILRRLLTGPYWINFPTTVMRRSLVEDAQFDPVDGLADDLGMCLRIVRRMEAVAYIADTLVAIRLHSGAHSANMGFHELQGDSFLPTPVAIANIRNARERFLRECGDELGSLNGIRASSHRWIRAMLMQTAKGRWRSGKRSRLVAWRLLREAARIDPLVVVTPEGMRFLVRMVRGPRR